MSSQGFDTAPLPSSTQQQPVAPSFGSFLNKTPTKDSASPAKPSSASKKGKDSPWQTFKKPSSAVKKSLEDESSKDFVPITNNKKRRVLTEHQKDVMRSRRDDIPALYSELSR